MSSRRSDAPGERDLLAKALRGLGDPTRLALLDALAEGEATVGELARRVGAPQPRVSSHLAVLRRCGLVEAERSHRHVRYAVADPRVGKLLELARGVLADQSALDSVDREADAQVELEVAADAAAGPARAAPGTYVVFALGEELYGLPAGSVREALPLVALRRLPSRRPTLLGMLDLRGTLLEAHDLATHLGLAAVEPGGLVVVEDRAGRALALAVGAFDGLDEVAAGDLREAGRTHPAVGGLAVRGGRLVLLLDPGTLVAALRGAAAVE
jgi:DNA-binding transcriptional ArsR family regulator/chemotaxis signal transduction protein